MFGRKFCRAAWLVLIVAAAPACSLKTMAVKTVANTLSDTGDVFSRDDDPELVRDAMPFALKLYESLLESVPKHVPLLVATCSSFTQYGYALRRRRRPTCSSQTAHEEATAAARARAQALPARHGATACARWTCASARARATALLQDPAAVVAKAESEDVPLLYWTAASWGAAISLGIDQPESGDRLSRRCARWPSARWRSTPTGARARCTS